MKKVLISTLLIAGFAASAHAYAYDGGMIGERERVVRYGNTCGKTCAKTCNRNCGAPRVSNCAPAPVRVKTHTEVVDYYQLYQPVTVYQPAGVVAERRVIMNPQPCQTKRCRY